MVVAWAALILMLVMGSTVGAQSPILYITGRPMLWLGKSFHGACDAPGQAKDLKDLCATSGFQPGLLEPGTKVLLLALPHQEECTNMVAIRVLDGPSKGNIGCIGIENLTSITPE